MSDHHMNDEASYHMAANSLLHSVESFIESLSVDDLQCLVAILDMVEGNSRNNGSLTSTAIRTRAKKLEVCPVCGKDHDKDLAEMANPAEASTDTVHKEEE